MAAAIDHAPLVEHDQAVERGDRREPVGTIAITVLPCISVVNCSWIVASTSESSAEVAFVEDQDRASLSSTRAIAMRWRWPPESLTPRSPTRESKPLRPS